MNTETGIEWVDTCESTNTLALAALDDERVCGVGADRQTAGRGRGGRSWLSPRGGLYFSWVARPRVDQSQGAVLPLLAGVAIARVCAQLGAPVSLKWPNDVLLDGRKLAGVLCEARPIAPGRWGAAVGIGLNLRTPAGGFPGDIPAIALDTVVDPPEPRALAETLLDELEGLMQTVRADGMRPVLSMWVSAGPAPGTRLRRGDTEGEYLGLAEDGALRLRTADGDIRVYAGDVEIC